MLCIVHMHVCLSCRMNTVYLQNSINLRIEAAPRCVICICAVHTCLVLKAEDSAFCIHVFIINMPDYVLAKFWDGCGLRKMCILHCYGCMCLLEYWPCFQALMYAEEI